MMRSLFSSPRWKFFNENQRGLSSFSWTEVHSPWVQGLLFCLLKIYTYIYVCKIGRHLKKCYKNDQRKCNKPRTWGLASNGISVKCELLKDNYADNIAMVRTNECTCIFFYFRDENFKWFLVFSLFISFHSTPEKITLNNLNSFR